MARPTKSRKPILSIAILGLLAVGIVAATMSEELSHLSWSLGDSLKPPFSTGWEHIAGTDDQGRDVAVLALLGCRTSAMIGLSAAALATVIGLFLGLAAGATRHAWLNRIVLLLADAQLSMPTILFALVLDGVVRSTLPESWRVAAEPYVLAVAFGIASWPLQALAIRSWLRVEMSKEYVLASRVLGRGTLDILRLHMLPGIGPLTLTLATTTFVQSVLAESSMTFIGIGASSTTPSLGAQIATGYGYLISGQYWLAVVPVGALLLLVVSAFNVCDWAVSRAR